MWGIWVRLWNPAVCDDFLDSAGLPADKLLKRRRPHRLGFAPIAARTNSSRDRIMRKWLHLLSLVSILLVLGSGCAACYPGPRPFRPGVLCDPTPCPDGACGLSGCSHAGVACGTAECDPCDPCGPCHYGHYSPLGPFAFVFRIFRPVTWVGPSCGERYWGDYLSDPPDCCDPCDCYGNYTGVNMRNCPRRGAGCACGTTADYGCTTGCDGGHYLSASSEYAAARRPAVPARQQTAQSPVATARVPRPIRGASAAKADLQGAVDRKIVNRQ